MVYPERPPYDDPGIIQPSGPSTLDWKVGSILVEEVIHKNEGAHVLRVSFEKQEYLMKVYHRMRRYYWHRDNNKEVDCFVRERNAYERLAAHGFCDRGEIPRFYGTITDIQPHQMLPHLRDFLDDKDLPCAIILEYIPRLKEFDLTTFNESRKDRLHKILVSMHQAGVYHGDIEARHMVIDQDSGNALWIDLDCSQTFPPSTMTKHWESEFEIEMLRTSSFLNALATNAQNGKLKLAYRYYYYGYPSDASENLQKPEPPRDDPADGANPGLMP